MDELLYNPATLAAVMDAVADPEIQTATEPPTEEEKQDMREQAKRWLQLDDQVRTLSVAIRERRLAQGALASKIQQFMDKFGYDDVSSSGNMIKTVTRKVKTQPKLKDVRKKLLDLPDGNDIVERIFTPCVVTEKRTIKRIIPKVSMSLDET